MARIAVLDPVSEAGLQALKSAGLEVVQCPGLKGDDLRRALLEVDGAVCRSGVKITREVLAGNRRLQGDRPGGSWGRQYRP